MCRSYELLLSGTLVIRWHTFTVMALGPYGWTTWRVSVMRRHWAVVDIVDGLCTTVDTTKMYQSPALVCLYVSYTVSFH